MRRIFTQYIIATILTSQDMFFPQTALARVKAAVENGVNYQDPSLQGAAAALLYQGRENDLAARRFVVGANLAMQTYFCNVAGNTMCDHPFSRGRILPTFVSRKEIAPWVVEEVSHLVYEGSAVKGGIDLLSGTLGIISALSTGNAKFRAALAGVGLKTLDKGLNVFFKDSTPLAFPESIGATVELTKMFRNGGDPQSSELFWEVLKPLGESLEFPVDEDFVINATVNKKVRLAKDQDRLKAALDEATEKYSKSREGVSPSTPQKHSLTAAESEKTEDINSSERNKTPNEKNGKETITCDASDKECVAQVNKKFSDTMDALATFKTIGLISILAGQPELGDKLCKSAEIGIAIANTMKAVELGNMTSTVATMNYVQIGMMAMSMLQGGKTEMQMISEQLQAIQQQIAQLQQEMHDRFDTVDMKLDRLYEVVNQRFNQVLSKLDNIEDDIGEVIQLENLILEGVNKISQKGFRDHQFKAANSCEDPFISGKIKSGLNSAQVHECFQLFTSLANNDTSSYIVSGIETPDLAILPGSFTNLQSVTDWKSDLLKRAFQDANYSLEGLRLEGFLNFEAWRAYTERAIKLFFAYPNLFTQQDRLLFSKFVIKALQFKSLFAQQLFDLKEKTPVMRKKELLDALFAYRGLTQELIKSTDVVKSRLSPNGFEVSQPLVQDAPNSLYQSNKDSEKTAYLFNKDSFLSACSSTTKIIVKTPKFFSGNEVVQARDQLVSIPPKEVRLVTSLNWKEAPNKGPFLPAWAQWAEAMGIGRVEACISDSSIIGLPHKPGAMPGILWQTNFNLTFTFHLKEPINGKSIFNLGFANATEVFQGRLPSNRNAFMYFWYGNDGTHNGWLSCSNEMTPMNRPKIFCRKDTTEDASNLEGLQYIFPMVATWLQKPEASEAFKVLTPILQNKIEGSRKAMQDETLKNTEMILKSMERLKKEIAEALSNNLTGEQFSILPKWYKDQVLPSGEQIVAAVLAESSNPKDFGSFRSERVQQDLGAHIKKLNEALDSINPSRQDVLALPRVQQVDDYLKLISNIYKTSLPRKNR